MKYPGLTLLVVTLLAVACLTNHADAVSRVEINKLRAKSVLTNEDMQLVDQFVQEQMSDIQFAQQFSVAADAAEQLRNTAQSEATVQSARQAWSQRFTQAVKAQVPALFQRANELLADEDLEQKELGRQIALAALIVMAACDNPALLDQILPLLQHERPEIRYWTVTALNKPTTLAALREDQALRGQVINALRTLLNRENPAELLQIVAEWASQLADDPQVDPLLQAIVAQRVQKYQAWNVSEEMCDLAILRAILNVAGTPTAFQQTQRRAALVRAAADLYCAAGTRYVKAMGYTKPDTNPPQTLPLLTDDSQIASETLLIQAEELFLALASRSTDVYRGRMRESIGSENWDRVQAALEALVGPDQGLINRAFNIYSTGQQITTVPDAPQEVVQRAETLSTLRRNLLEVEY